MNNFTGGWGGMNKLPDTYICDRCKQPGHHIRDCPENGNSYFDPCQNRGVPKQHIWKMQLKLNDSEFQLNAGNVVKSLLKQNEIYSLDESDVKGRNKDQEAEETTKTKGASEDTIPPSLACEICHQLIKNATLTPCCLNSCCFECLKSYLTSSHKLANRRAGVCPIPSCGEQDIFVEELIPNHALSKAAEWFNRQKISKMASEDIEVDKP